MDNFRTLREYQEYLRSRMEAASGEGAADKVVLLGFLAGGKHYLVDGRDVVDVSHIAQLEPIPVSKKWVAGASNIKGTVYAVTDFSVLNGGPETKRGKFMTLPAEIMPGAALLIDGISSLFESHNLGEMTEINNNEHPWIVGTFEIGQVSYSMVDLMKLAKDARFSILQSGEAQ